MVYKEIIVDADFCIKLGSSEKYRYLERILPLLSENVFVHETVNEEVKTPRGQINALLASGKMTVLTESSLNEQEQRVYAATFAKLAKVMLDKHNPNKNRGEVCSLAMAKVKGIPCFVTDERNLQPIIDSNLNTGMNDITCVRVIDIVGLIKDGQLPDLARKDAKNIWIIAGKDKSVFDHEIWPIA